MTFLSTVLAFTISQFTLKHKVTVIKSDVEVYKDENLTQLLTHIDWGTLYTGETKTIIAYIKNNVDTTFNLTMHTEEWQPSLASEYISISWNYTLFLIYPNEVKPVEFIIHVSEFIVGITDFSNVIVITAYETK